MSNKIYTKKYWDNKKDKENKDYKDLDCKSNKVCTPYLPTYCQNRKANLFMKSDLKKVSLLRNHYHGIARLTYSKESRKKKMKEDKEFFKKLLTSIMTLTCLKDLRKWFKEENKLNKKSKGPEL